MGRREAYRVGSLPHEPCGLPIGLANAFGKRVGERRHVVLDREGNEAVDRPAIKEARIHRLGGQANPRPLRPEAQVVAHNLLPMPGRLITAVPAPTVGQPSLIQSPSRRGLPEMRAQLLD